MKGANVLHSEGVLYREGEGCEYDCRTALKYFRLSADQANANAYINLGESPPPNLTLPIWFLIGMA